MPARQLLASLSVTALLLGLVFAESTQEGPATTTVACDRYRKTGFWDIDIDNKPALPPECGPPLSFHSDRDLAHLPYQIAGIIASYVAFTLGVGIAILSIRRQRKKLQAPETVELKLVGNESRRFEPSLASPASSITSWMRNPLRRKASSLGSSGAAGDVSALHSPGIDSVTSFNQNTLDTDRMSRQNEMERLYAAVMAHDAARQSQISQAPKAEPIPESRPEPEVNQNFPRASITSTGSRPADKRLQRITQLNTRLPMNPTSNVPQSPMSPVRAIYPPDHDVPPLSPTSPIRATVPDDFWPRPGKPKLRIESASSNQVPAPLISAGLMSPSLQKIELPNDMYPASPPPGERRMRLPGQPYPTTPGFYPITPISPGPMSQAIYTNVPQTPRTPKTPKAFLPNDMYPQANQVPQAPGMGFPEPVRRPASTRSFGSGSESVSSKSTKGRKILQNMRINTGLKPNDQDADDRAPLSADFRKEQEKRQESSNEATTPETPEGTDLEDKFESMNSTIPPVPQSRLASPRRPPQLNLKLPVARVGSMSSLGSAAGLPSSPAPSNRNLAPPPASRPSASNNGAAGSRPLPFRVAFQENPLISPAPVKTTFLERKKEALGRGLGTAKTPMTGVPQTPYSAYMPFTPVTPVTPHLTTRKERKQKKKEMGKTLMDDSALVREEDEEWE